jgi:NADH dehydrogenase FAD-containing subunit
MNELVRLLEEIGSKITSLPAVRPPHSCNIPSILIHWVK